MNEDSIAKAIASAKEQFTKLQQQGAVHEREIAKHQNALLDIREELTRLQGEVRALTRLQDNQPAPWQQKSTPSSKETPSEQSPKNSA